MKNISRLPVSPPAIPPPSFAFCYRSQLAGVGLLHRKTAAKSEPTIEISASGDRYEIKWISALRELEAAFHLGQEVEYQRLDGTKVTSVFSLEDSKLSERQRAGEVTVSATWTFSYPALTIESVAGGVTGTEVYKRL
jgi:hypothetical protein